MDKHFYQFTGGHICESGNYEPWNALKTIQPGKGEIQRAIPIQPGKSDLQKARPFRFQYSPNSLGAPFVGEQLQVNSPKARADSKVSSQKNVNLNKFMSSDIDELLLLEDDLFSEHPRKKIAPVCISSPKVIQSKMELTGKKLTVSQIIKARPTSNKRFFTIPRLEELHLNKEHILNQRKVRILQLQGKKLGKIIDSSNPRSFSVNKTHKKISHMGTMGPWNVDRLQEKSINRD